MYWSVVINRVSSNDTTLISGVPQGSVLESIRTTNLAACVRVQILTNFCTHALISTPNVPKILFA